MLSYIGSAAEIAHSQDCKQISNNDLTSYVCSKICPIARSMSYIAGAFSPRPSSAKSMLSFPSPRSSVIEESTPEELSEGDKAITDTRATSVATESRKKRSRGSSAKNVAKTVFHLAHPPPISVHKQNLHIRPRVLLQLQRASTTSRPTPALEVLPSFVFASRLARRFPRTFKGKAGLGADDLAIVTSEDYRSDDAENGESDGIFEGERWDKREIVAAICQPAKDAVGNQGRAEICLNSGPSWAASRLRNGAYEFVSVDEHGLRTVARWVPRHPKGNSAKDRSTCEERKFNFSLLNPNSRRHAIIACLDRHSIEVSSQYTDPPLPRSDNTASTPAGSFSGSGEEDPPKAPIEVSPALRMLIVITAIYVSFQEGFSSLFRNKEITPTSPNLGSKHQRRSLSLNSTQIGNSPMSSPTSANFSNTQRARARLQHTNSTSAVPVTSSNTQLQGLSRSNSSASGAFIQRIRSRNQSTFKGNQLSPVVGPGDSDEGRNSDRQDNDQISRASSLYSEVSSPGLEDGPESSNDTPYGGLGVVEEDSVAAPTAIKKSKRLSRMFRLSRRIAQDS